MIEATTTTISRKALDQQPLDCSRAYSADPKTWRKSLSRLIQYAITCPLPQTRPPMNASSRAPNRNHFWKIFPK
jgi:hypothetical protein